MKKSKVSSKEIDIKRFTLALVISILIHTVLIFLIYYLLLKPEVKKKAISKSKITLNINQIQTSPPPRAPEPKETKKINSPKNPPPQPIKTPKSPEKEEIKEPQTPPPPAPKKPSPKESQSRGFVTKKIVKKDENITKTKKLKITTKKKPKPTKPKKVVKKETKKPKPKKVTKAQPKTSKKTTQKVVQKRHRPRGPSAKLINSLYGSSYSKMSSLQRRFIDHNLRRILLISQRTLNYLGYPREAMVMGQSGTNIVEFWLYPNGDIRGLRLKRRIGASSLDRQTIEVIKTAYMNYPRPPVKTKIIIYVKYQLY